MLVTCAFSHHKCMVPCTGSIHSQLSTPCFHWIGMNLVPLCVTIHHQVIVADNTGIWYQGRRRSCQCDIVHVNVIHGWSSTQLQELINVARVKLVFCKCHRGVKVLPNVVAVAGIFKLFPFPMGDSLALARQATAKDQVKATGHLAFLAPSLLEHLVRPQSHEMNQMVLQYVLHLRHPCHVRIHNHVRMHRWLLGQQQAAEQAHLLGANVAK